MSVSVSGDGEMDEIGRTPTIMAMFPLGTVLLPGSILPLHVFEPRYRQMMVDCLAGESEFGVTLITRGRETGGGDVRASVGTVARIMQSNQFPDGRSAHITVGVRRIRIHEWLPDDPYPKAIVSDWPDVAVEVPAGRVAEVHRAVRRTLALAIELGDTAVDADTEIADDPLMASYHLSALAPVGSLDQLRLLSAPDATARLDALVETVADVDAALRFRLGTPDM